MKLIGERVLGGRVAFVSAAGEGTTFSILVPRRLPVARDAFGPPTDQ
jgi:signal transduction histidine kinase